MKGFIVHPGYKIVDDRAYVLLYGRLENGESFCTVNYFKPYFFIKKSDLKKAQKLEDFESEDIGYKNKDGEEVVKIITNLPGDVPLLRKTFSDEKIKHYEADIKFPYRFLIEKGINGCVEIDGEYTKEDKIGRVYNEPELSPTNYKPNLKILSIDIETDMESKDIYCMSLVCEEFKKVLIVSKDKKLKHAEVFSDEEKMLTAFVNYVNEIDPDVITGWNVIGFDLNVIAKNCKKYDVDFNIGRDESRVKLTIETDFFRESKADVPGRVVLDALHLLRMSFIKVTDYKLDTVASELLGEAKDVKFVDKGNEIQDMYANEQQKLVDYNLKDSELVLKIIEKTGTVDLTIQRSMLTGMPPDRVNASIASFDSLYIKEAHKRNLVVPTADFSEREGSTVGGYVRESAPGIYDYLVILDFKSVYPSIIRTFNIDPLALDDECELKNPIKLPNGTCYNREKGILPEIIEGLWKHRDIAKKANNELARYAIKILMNSFYGVLASPSCRFFSHKLANSITETGHYIIKLTSDKIQEKGYKVIYNDTDSTFVLTGAKSLKEAEKIGIELQDYINEFYEKFIKKEFGCTSVLELEYDKCFVKCIMPKLRGSDSGAKKRYAGMVIEDGKEKVEVTGMEAVRGDWTGLAKKYQYEILDKIFHDKDIIDYTRKFIKDLQAGKYDDLLVYKKSLRKGLEGYAVETPHKKAAKKIIERGGKLEGSMISYVITSEGPEPVGYVQNKIDYKHYIDKQIKPIAESVLVFFGQDFDDILKGSRQKGLGEF